MPIYEHVVVAEDNSFPGKGGTALTTRVNTLTANKLEALAVGTVTTGAEGSNASVSITGTAPSQSISFTIPRGSKGDAGTAGAPGERGPAALDTGIRHSSKSYVIPAGGEVSIDNSDVPSSGSIFMAIDGNGPMPVWVQIYRSGTYNGCKLITPQATPQWTTGDTAQPAGSGWKIWVEGNDPGALLKLSTTAGYGRRVRFFWYDLFAGAGNMGGASQGITITGMVPTSASLPASHQSGDAYLANDTGMLHISNGTTWSDGVPIRGPIGEQGPIGPQGIQGIKGDTGNQGIQGVKGDTGNAGPANVLSIGTVTTGAAGSSASVSVSGTSPTQSLSFTIPQGAQGIQGTAGTTPTVGVGTVTTGAAGSTVQVTNGGTATARTFNFTIPRGDQGIQGVQGIPGTTPTVGVGTVTTGAAGSSVAVTEGGTSTARTFNFTIPRGDQGIQGVAGTTPTVGVGTVTTGAAGSTVQVTNGGTATARTFNFTIPRGDTGAPGTTPTVGVGTVTTGAEGSTVSVTEGGTSTARTFNFTIPRGNKGDQGNPGTPGTAGRGITSIADTDGDGTATVTYTDATTSSLILPGAGPEGNPVIKYFLDAVRNRASTPVKIVLDGSSTANGGIVTRPAQKLVDRLSAMMTKNSVRTDLSVTTATDIQWYEIADGGTQANNYVTASDVTGIGNVQPTLMIHMIGSNDYGVQKDPAVFLSEIRTVVNNIQAVSPNTRHLFIAHQAKNDMTPSTYPFHLYVDQMWNLSREKPGMVSVVDLAKKFQRVGVPGTDVWGLVATDNVHLDEWGSKILAYMILEELGFPLPPESPEVIKSTYHAVGGTTTTGTSTSYIQHEIVIPPRPYPRVGMYHASIFVTVTTAGSGNMELISYRSGSKSLPATGAQSTVETFRTRIPKDTQPKNVTNTAQVYIASHETVVIEGYISIGTGNAIYVTGNGGYGAGWVQLSPA